MLCLQPLRRHSVCPEAFLWRSACFFAVFQRVGVIASPRWVQHRCRKASRCAMVTIMAGVG